MRLGTGIAVAGFCGSAAAVLIVHPQLAWIALVPFVALFILFRL